VAFQSVATVTVTPAAPNIVAGQTQQFTAEARDGDNNVMTGVTFFWASADHNRATIDQTGLATAIKGGVVRITAVGKGQPGGVDLTITPQILMYKDTPGWGPAPGGEEVALRGPPFFFESGVDYQVRPMSALAAGIPAGVKVVIFPSIAQGGTAAEAQATTQNQAASQTAIDNFATAGGWIIGHMGNNTTAGYTFPGLTGGADNTSACTGLTITAASTHAFVRGPDEIAASGDDLTNTNIDTQVFGWCNENHGSLAGILPAGAQVLLTEQGGGIRPVYASYARGSGAIVVTTITLEGMVLIAPTLRNSYWWVFRAAGAPVSGAPVDGGVAVQRAMARAANPWVSSERRR
jgi:hypothetical protein